jgi:hypothetical protein
MLASLLVALAMLTVRSRFDDPDMWWHLRMGEIVCATGHIPTTDIFSYTTNHHSWVPHEWLSQVTIYAAYELGGYRGLMLWLCLTTASLLVAGYLLCSLYAGNSKIGMAGAMLIWFFATAGTAIRPQMIGYLLLTIELLLLHLGLTRSRRWFAALPPLFAIWVNCHGSFFLGLATAFVLLLCSGLEFRAGSLAAARWPAGARRALAISMFFCLLALFLNPVGIHQILYPLDTLLRQPVSLKNVQEWMPLQITDPRGGALAAVAAGILLLAAMGRAEIRLQELALLIVGAWLALNHRRMVFVFGILVAPMVSRMLADWWDGYDAERDHPAANAVLIALALAAAYLAFPSSRNLAGQVAEKSPVKAVEFIKAHHLAGPMMNDYVFGGYLIWALPEQPVFIDGRGDVFEWTSVLTDYGRWATLESRPNELLDKYRVAFCLLSRDSPMVQVLPLLGNWGEAYSDNQSVIFVRTPKV